MNNKFLVILLVLAIALVGMGAVYSLAEFGTANIFAVVNALLQLSLTDRSYFELAAHPKVILAQPDASLSSYMAEQGYIPKADAQLGSLHVFTNGEDKQMIFASVNAWFAKWSWQE